MSITQTPNPIPCGSSGTLVQGANEVAKSSEGTQLDSAKLYDEALHNAFIHAQYEALTSAKCGGACHPWVENVTVTIRQVDYEKQWLWGTVTQTTTFKCAITYNWTATVACQAAKMPPFLEAQKTTDIHLG